MLENMTKAQKAKDIDDALRHMHEKYGGESYSLGAIANFIGVKKGKVQEIEEKALTKVRKLLWEKHIHEYDRD